MSDILIVFGTRPEAIKMAPLVRAFNEDKEIDSAICITAQHRQMLDQVLTLFDIKPDYDLDIMEHGQDLFDVTSKILLKMRKTITDVKPKLVLVHGDTTTSMITAMACFYLSVPIAHVEAGLRTNNMLAPFPEEFNRRVTGLISQLHFAPTEKSRDNLLKEGVDPDIISVTGNTVIDALHWALSIIRNDETVKRSVKQKLDEQIPFDYESQKFILITGHRRENFGGGFLEICEAISTLADKYQEVNFVYPVHLNPNVTQPVNKILSKKKNVFLIQPLEYLAFIYLLSNCHLVLTDSGGIQEEAPSLGKPVLVMRDTTERPEAVEAGTVKLVGAQKHRIIEGVSELLDNADCYNEMSKSLNPYGDGTATPTIVTEVKRFLKKDA